MKIYFKILFVIVIYFLLSRVCIELKLYISNHGEDTYQIEKSTRDNTIQRVMSYTIFDFKKKIKWQEYLINTVHKLQNLYESVTKNYSFHYYKSNEMLSLKPSEETILTKINMKTKTITTIFDHSYCSGNFFLEYGAIISNGEVPKLPIFPSYFGIAEYYLMKFAIDRPDLPNNKVFSIVKNTGEMKRLYFTLNIKNKPNEQHTRTWVLYNVLNNIYHSMITKRELNIMIPVPFRKETKISNNIGVLFIKYEDCNIIKLQNNINTSKYQAISTNYYLKLNMNKKIGKNVRNNVDIIFSSGYVKNPLNKNVKSITTYNGVPDYGIYCLTGCMGDLIQITLTVSTNDIDFDKLKKLCNNSEVLEFSS